MRLSWNTATSFGLGGYLLAGTIAWTYLGWYWIYLPGVVAALAAGYGVSTWLGLLMARNTSRLLSCIIAGIGVALATLTAGVLALGAVNIFLAWLDDATPVPTGFGPFTSLMHSVEDYVVKPTFGVLLFGGWIAILLGLVYGALLYLRSKSRRSTVSPVQSSQSFGMSSNNRMQRTRYG